jgi:simple sugar transport system substrate-binding protein
MSHHRRAIILGLPIILIVLITFLGCPALLEFFDQPPTASITITPTSGYGVGQKVTLDSASSDPQGYSLTYDWALSGPTGSQITLSATDQKTVNFTPDVQGPYHISLTVKAKSKSASTSKDITVSAAPYTVTTAVSPTNSGTVTLNPSGGSYASGTPVTVTANPSAGYSFRSWSGDASGTANPTTVTVTQNMTITANFSMTVGYCGASGGSWRDSLANSILSEATKRGDTVVYVNGNEDQATQIAAIRSFISQKVRVIGLDPVIGSGWDTVLGEAKAAGIPVIVLDRPVSADTSLWATIIGSDFDLEGQNAGIWVRDRSGIASGSLAIAELQGTAGSWPAIDRAAGFRKIIDSGTIILSAAANFDFTQGKTQMAAWLTGGQMDNINVVYAHNDSMALGAIEAIEEHFGAEGKKPGIDIKTVSIDAVKGALEAILAGKINCSVQCSPLLGPQFFDAAEKLAEGETVSRWIKTEEGIYTSANVTQSLIDQWPY